MPRTKKTDTAPITDEPPTPTAAIEPFKVSRKQIDLLAEMFVANDLQRPDGPVRCVVSGTSELFAPFTINQPDIVIVDINRNGDGGNFKPVKVTGYTLVKCGETEIGTRPFTSGDGYQHLAVTWEGGRYITMDEVVFVYDEALDACGEHVDDHPLTGQPDVRKIVEGLALLAGAPELPLLKRCQREVEATLDTEQILVLSAKASAINGEKVNKEKEKKDYDKEIGDEIKALELQENAIMKTLRDNFTVDVIEVDERADYERCIVRIFRTGTNEQIATRALTHEERQTAMHFDDGDGTTDLASPAFTETATEAITAALHTPCVYCDDQEGGCAECTKLPGDLYAVEQEGVAEMEAGIAREHDFEEAITTDVEALIGGEDERTGVGYPVRA